MLGNYKPFTITLMGSMPRTPEVHTAFSDYNANRIDREEYMDIILDETNKVVKLQEEAGIDIITSGEFERDNYMSFVAQKVEGISLYSTDELTAITQHKQEEFVESLSERDADDNSMNSPAATGKIDIKADFVIDEMRELRKMTNLPLKATVPSPYLLTRNLWVKELTKGHYESRRDLSKDVLKLVRNEVKKLIDFGVEVIQLDEPILAEVCFTNDDAARSFYWGVLSERALESKELEFAHDLIKPVLDDMREANVVSQLHVCRGNFTRQESSLLEGNYEKLSDFFVSVAPDMLTLELSTPRAGDISALFSNPELAKKVAIGVGVVNPRTSYIETPEEIVAAVEQAMKYVQDPQRIWLNPDCGFATFANRPMNEMDIIRQKIESMVKAQDILRSKYA